MALLYTFLIVNELHEKTKPTSVFARLSSCLVLKSLGNSPLSFNKPEEAA